MEILFLGTSSGWPLPRLGCSCAICTSEDTKDKRLRPSILINGKVLIDASPDIYHQIKIHHVDPTQISHILITHAHDDHIAGLYDLSHIYQKGGRVNLLATREVIFQMRKKVGTSMLSFRIQEVKPFAKTNLRNDFDCWFIPVQHSVPAYGIKIKAPKPILYAPEFRKILPSSKKDLGDLELAIIDGSSKSLRGQAKGHETIEEGIRLSKDIRAKKILFTNIGHITDTQQNLVNFVKYEGGDKFNIAFDGLVIKLS